MEKNQISQRNANYQKRVFQKSQQILIKTLQKDVHHKFK